MLTLALGCTTFFQDWFNLVILFIVALEAIYHVLYAIRSCHVHVQVQPTVPMMTFPT